MQLLIPGPSPTMSAIPAEIMGRVTGFLECSAALQLEASGQAQMQALIAGEQYWQGRVLTAASHQQRGCSLKAILSSHLCKAATRVDLSALDIDDTELSFISQHLDRIEWIDLSGCRQISDLGLEALLSRHGRHLRVLRTSRLCMLTNYAAECVARRCPQLQRLHLEGTMISASGLRVIAEACPQLVRLNISQCHLIDLDQLAAIAAGGHFKRLRRLELRGQDFLQPYQLDLIVQGCTSMRRLDVRGCAEITLKTLRQLREAHLRLRIDHNARLEDHSLCSIRRYLLSMIESC